MESYMNKKMFDLEVDASDDGYIDLIQHDPAGEDDYIRIHPDQVDLLIQWLKEAREQLLEAEQ